MIFDFELFEENTKTSMLVGFLLGGVILGIVLLAVTK